MAGQADVEFPSSLELQFPFPTARLASTALKALQVDPELSPLVRRQFSLVEASTAESSAGTGTGASAERVLKVDYQATTNRMLRVAVNSFMDSLKLVVEVMEGLDVDVLNSKNMNINSS